MGLNDEDEDLVALRLAALSTMKAKRASENSLKLKSSSVGGVSIRDGFGNRNNALFQPHFNSNLIAIVPISPSTEAEQPRSRRVAFRHQQPEPKTLILPQHRYCKTDVAVPRKKEKPAVKTKFNRYDSSSSDSSEESDDEGSTASGEGGAAVITARHEPIRAAPSPEPLGGDADASSELDPDTEPSFLVELEGEAAPVREEEKKKRVPDPVVLPAVAAPPPPSPPPPAPRQTPPPARSRSRSPFYAYADRSRSRSRSRPRLGRSRSPRRYGPRRSTSPKRRAASPPRYSSPRRRSPSPARRRSPSPPRRRLSSPRRRYASPGPPSPPRRRPSPFDRLSPGRRRSSPWRRPSPGRRYSPSPRRRKSPSPVKRNPSPPRRFSPQRRSPLGRRVSPPRRNPSPPRKLYPAGGQLTGRPHSPRRYPSPLPARGGLSPRRYNAVGDMSPWSPPRNNGLRSVSPQFARKRSPPSPRPILRNNNNNRPSPPPSPRLPPLKRRDSGSPRFEPRRGSPSPPRPDHKRRRGGLGSPPRPAHRRGSNSPTPLSGGRRKSVSPPRADRKGPGPPSPRFAPKRRRSFSPRGPRPGSKKRSPSPGGQDRGRAGVSPPKSRRVDERDARAAIRGPREAAATTTTTTTTTAAAARDNSKSLSLSPPPDRVKVKSPLRLRARRHERVNGKKRTKSKKSRDKTSTAPTIEKTENKGDKSSVLEARRRKFESVDPIKPVNKKIRLKTTTEEPAPPPAPSPSPEHSAGGGVEEGERPDTPQEPDDDDDALVLDSPADLWSDEETDSGNEGRFKGGGKAAPPPRIKVGVPSFTSLLQPSARPAEPRRGRGGERRSPPRDRKRRRERGGARGRPAPPSVLDRIGERGAGAWRGGKGAETPDQLPALLSKDISKPDQISKSVDTAPDPTDRVSRLDSVDQHGDLRAALSRKRAARSNILFPFKCGDKGKVPGSRLVQSAFLDAVGKRQKRSKKSLIQPSLLQVTNNLGGAGKDARRVTLYDKVKASVKRLSESVTLATDESMLTTETRFSDDETARKPPVRLRLGLPQHADDYPGGRKVKLKRNNNNAAGDQV